MEIAGRLIDRRLRQNLSQKQLAARAGMSPAQLNRYERGRSHPNLATMERLARALRLPVRDLFW